MHTIFVFTALLFSFCLICEVAAGPVGQTFSEGPFPIGRWKGPDLVAAKPFSLSVGVEEASGLSLVAKVGLVGVVLVACALYVRAKPLLFPSALLSHVDGSDAVDTILIASKHQNLLPTSYAALRNNDTASFESHSYPEFSSTLEPCLV